MGATFQHGWDRVLVAALLMAASCVCGCGGKPTIQSYASPAEVMAAEQSAYKNRDWSTYVDCFTPESHEKAAKFFLPVFAGSLPPLQIKVEIKSGKQTTSSGKETKFPPLNLDKSTPAEKAEKLKRQEEFRAMCAKHGLTDWERHEGENNKQYGARLAAQIKDKRAFMIDLWVQMSPNLRRTAKHEELAELKIDGDNARGQLGHREGKIKESQEVEFKKIGESWRIANPGIFH